MATAPTPGKKRKQRVGIQITLRGDTRVLHMADLGPQDDMVARKETGMPVSSFIGEDVFALDSVAILWWVACRKSGQPRLKFRDVLKEFPSYAELEDMGDSGDFAIDALEEEDGDHPLPSAEAS